MPPSPSFATLRDARLNRTVLSPDIAAFQPDEPCPFTLQGFLTCLRTARRGAAATNEHLRTLLDHEEDSQLLHCAAQRLAHADVPAPALAAVRVGRLVALQKPNGWGVRALVVGDALHRLVGRTLAQAFAPHFEQACFPHQYGLSTRAGSEALPRVLRAAAEVDARATVLSVDAVGAFDHVSRQAMLGAPLARPALRPLLPFARQFYGTPSSYVWVDAQGVTHRIAQARIWNAAGEEPPGISVLQADPDTAVWVGDWALPPDQQGLTVLGTPFGSDAYVQRRLDLKREESLSSFGSGLFSRTAIVKSLHKTGSAEEFTNISLLCLLHIKNVREIVAQAPVATCSPAN